MLLLNFFGIDHNMRDVDALNKHSPPTFIHNKIGYFHKKLIHLVSRVLHHSKIMLWWFSEIDAILLYTHTPLTSVDDFLHFTLP